MRTFNYILALSQVAHCSLDFTWLKQTPFHEGAVFDPFPYSGSRPGLLPGAPADWRFRWSINKPWNQPESGNNGIVFEYLDTMDRFMERFNISQAQLSVRLHGKEIISQAYTWENQNWPVTWQGGPFLLASVSKIFCVAVIQAMMKSGKLSSETKVYPALNMSTLDPRAQNITVRNLLEHYGGDDRSMSGDPVFMMREIAQTKNYCTSDTPPVSERDIIEWKKGKNLDHAPGTVYAYSNYDYLLLGYLAWNVGGYTSYFDVLNQTVLWPHGFNVKPWPTAEKYHVNDNTRQIDTETGLSAITPCDFTTKVKYVYGGDDMYKESALAAASLATSASTMTQVLQTYPAWGWTTGRSPGSWRDGTMPGAFTWVKSLDCGVDFAIMFNSKQWNTECVGNTTSCGTTSLVDQLKQVFKNTLPGFAQCWGSAQSEL